MKSNKSISFIGGGRITKILLTAFENKSLKFKSLSVYDPNPETLNSLKKKFPEIETVNSIEAVSEENIVILAVHPPVMNEVLEKAAPLLSEDSIIISLAPKIKIKNISSKMPRVKNIARLIPNATSIINEGFNPVTFSDVFNAEQKKELFKLLMTLGHTFEVPENKLESYAVVSAMAPTYFWFQWKKLTEIGKETGMDEDEAKEAVYQTMKASLHTFFASGMSADEVFDLIPVKPIGENEKEIEDIFDKKLKGLYSKLSS